MTIAEKKKEFSRILFLWHKTHYRDMEWRKTSDPYLILVSEIMLQQTGVVRVRLKYEEFISRFPTVHALADATLGDVLRVWQGLGYNRRAKFLHMCARSVDSLYGGVFPKTDKELRILPGIGMSTAAALLAFAFGHDTPMIDTNVRRILVRTFFKNKMRPTDRALYDFACTLIPKGKGRAWNYAMLDLGATLCTARAHANDCPLNQLHGAVTDFVYKKPQKKFAESDRYYRGRIIAMLAHKPCSQKTLQKELQLDDERLEKLLRTLCRDALIVKRGRSLALP
jgi:A/G-specific adenine glycosylase